MQEENEKAVKSQPLNCEQIVNYYFLPRFNRRVPLFFVSNADFTEAVKKAHFIKEFRGRVNFLKIAKST